MMTRERILKILVGWCAMTGAVSLLLGMAWKMNGFYLAVALAAVGLVLALVQLRRE